MSRTRAVTARRGGRDVTLPLLLSVPHAGLSVPGELAGGCLLTAREIAEDGDGGAREIYALEAEVAAFVTTDVARAVLDVNRAPDDRRADGVVKTHTCWDVPIWRQPLSDEMVEWLFATHYRPYHATLSRAAGARVVLGVDCHTMAEVGPPIGPDHGVRRPAGCVSNADGTCPAAWVETLARLLAQGLAGEVRINDPFRGGYIARHHARELPWVQIELSRAPSMSLAAKRAAVLAALRGWCDELEQERGEHASAAPRSCETEPR